MKIPTRDIALIFSLQKYVVKGIEKVVKFSFSFPRGGWLCPSELLNDTLRNPDLNKNWT